MNSVFTEVAAGYRLVEHLTHKQRIARMYRKALKTAESWASDREIFLLESAKLRQRFEANRNLPIHASARILREAEEELLSWTHPDPYTVSYMPGGSKYMRNPALPLEAVFPDGIPPEYNIAPMTVTCVQVPVSATPEGPEKVLVNSYTKQYA